MRRALFAVVAGLMVVALIAPIAAAKPATSFVAKASAGAPGGHLHVMAQVKHPVRGSTPFSAIATVHFGGTTGDVTVPLNRHGRSFVAGAKVPILAGQPPGTVVVVVTITYDSVADTETFNAKIEPDTTD